MSRAVMEQALEAIEGSGHKADLMAAADALRAALAEQAQPVDPWPKIRRDFEQRMRAEGYTPTCLTWLDGGFYASPAVEREWKHEKLKYTTPPAPQPLTDEDIDAAWESAARDLFSPRHAFARAVWDLALKRMGVQR